jgi:hypothetical protein
MKKRIAETPLALLSQLDQAKTAATALGASWPAGAPSILEMTTAISELETAHTDAVAAEIAVRVKRAERRAKMKTGQGIVRRVDLATDMLFGREDVRKLQFGLEPWGRKGEEIARLVRIVTEDGPLPGSIRVDWEAIDGCTY